MMVMMVKMVMVVVMMIQARWGWGLGSQGLDPQCASCHNDAGLQASPLQLSPQMHREEPCAASSQGASLQWGRL